MHPAEDLAGVIGQLSRFCEPIRKMLEWPRLGVGLWLAAPLAHQLANDNAALDELKSELDSRSLEVVTLNGFPYQAFQAEVVKLDVYSPDWTERARLNFTIDLARVLQQLLPEDAEMGTISTLPVAWRNPVPPANEQTELLQELARELKKLAASGPTIKVALEPEPGCLIESIEQAGPFLKNISPEWIGVCLDACHLAVQFEAADVSSHRLHDNNISIYKAQISSGLRIRSPKSAEWVNDFIEPRFLHQTRERLHGKMYEADDLPEAREGGLPGSSEWRTHFHVPVHSEDPRTTRDELIKTIKVLVGGTHPLTTHLEVETYTWTVLPEDQRPVDDDGLINGIAEELKWTAEQLTKLGLKAEDSTE